MKKKKFRARKRKSGYNKTKALVAQKDHKTHRQTHTRINICNCQLSCARVSRASVSAVRCANHNCEREPDTARSVVVWACARVMRYSDKIEPPIGSSPKPPRRIVSSETTRIAAPSPR
ncbi:unnamed protein product [Trichogramma brassicae]|uniref:Uncharacterized protein n=1 Tax=Trichogramma brassicae TaxID=86971 RepID=A0A6H5I5E2_9HYME|nr:unnamed protein product [Trichogramma brassicae]